MAATNRITRADLEGKLRQINNQIEQTAEAAKPSVVAIGAAGGAVAILLAFLLGRRRGRRRSTVVEIRRV